VLSYFNTMLSKETVVGFLKTEFVVLHRLVPLHILLLVLDVTFGSHERST
jgi:hypothetical protein